MSSRVKDLEEGTSYDVKLAFRTIIELKRLNKKTSFSLSADIIRLEPFLNMYVK